MSKNSLIKCVNYKIRALRMHRFGKQTPAVRWNALLPGCIFFDLRLKFKYTFLKNILLNRWTIKLPLFWNANSKKYTTIDEFVKYISQCSYKQEATTFIYRSFNLTITYSHISVCYITITIIIKAYKFKTRLSGNT